MRSVVEEPWSALGQQRMDGPADGFAGFDSGFDLFLLKIPSLTLVFLCALVLYSMFWHRLKHFFFLL